MGSRVLSLRLLLGSTRPRIIDLQDHFSFINHAVIYLWVVIDSLYRSGSSNTIHNYLRAVRYTTRRIDCLRCHLKGPGLSGTDLCVMWTGQVSDKVIP